MFTGVPIIAVYITCRRHSRKTVQTTIQRLKRRRTNENQEWKQQLAWSACAKILNFWSYLCFLETLYYSRFKLEFMSRELFEVRRLLEQGISQEVSMQDFKMLQLRQLVRAAVEGNARLYINNSDQLETSEKRRIAREGKQHVVFR